MGNSYDKQGTSYEAATMEASKLDGKRGGFRRFIAMNTAGLITGYVE